MQCYKGDGEGVGEEVGTFLSDWCGQSVHVEENDLKSMTVGMLTLNRCTLLTTMAQLS